VGKLLPQCCSVLLLLTFSAPPLEELAMLDFLSMPVLLLQEVRLHFFLREGVLHVLSTA